MNRSLLRVVIATFGFVVLLLFVYGDQVVSGVTQPVGSTSRPPTLPEENKKATVSFPPVTDDTSPQLTEGSRRLTPSPTSPPQFEKLHDLERQLREVESLLDKDTVANFKFQDTVPRSNATRSHHFAFEDQERHAPIPIPRHCKSRARPDHFCAPNLGRDWSQGDTVFPISYSLPQKLYATTIPEKDKDCSSIVPRLKKSYGFTNEKQYVKEYSRSLYCITFKKGGWDALRHYEIIAAGCMPYMPDIDYSPEYVLYHLPKKLLLEARDLPGVYFNCSTVQVVIDHSIFPRERYMQLLQQLLDHAQKHLTTVAMAKYFLKAMGKPQAKKVLVIGKVSKRTMLKAQGQYNSWTLFHGLRTLLGAGAVDTHKVSFLYEQPQSVQEKMKNDLYGKGFGYAFQLPHIEVDRSNLVDRIKAHEFDLILFGDVSSVAIAKAGKLAYLDEIKAVYKKSEVAFLHVPDIPYGDWRFQGFQMDLLYSSGVVFQREIADCEYYAPAASRKSEIMKRCAWYLTKNCFDDVDIPKVLAKTKWKSYPWDAAK